MKENVDKKCYNIIQLNICLGVSLPRRALFFKPKCFGTKRINIRFIE